MRKGIILTVFVLIASILVTAYPNGAARNDGRDATGAEGSQGGCGGGGCHSSATTDATKVELDSAGVAVTSYHGGGSYTVKISASNGSSSSFTHFGFQLVVVKATGAGTNSAVNIGTWGTLPTGVQNTTSGTSGLNINIIEQSQALNKTTGTGGNGSTYVESIPWTAPVAGTGSVVIYGIVNELTNQSPSAYMAATPVTITEATVVAAVASVSIAQTTGSASFCQGSSATFTATPTNGGTSPTYQWKVNGTTVSGATASTFTSTTLAAGSDVVTCVMTSNLSGVTGSPATSNSVTVTVTASVTPAVSITSTATTTCAGQNITFTAAPTNGGTTPAYQWKNNGTIISGATNATYSSSSLANNSAITCVLTSNATCVTASTATSNTITITITSPVTPSVSISSTGSVSCSGQNITFTATPINGGTTPAYQWQNNGTAISGATAATYSSSSLANNAAITCVLTSNAGCVTTSTATSNTITVTISNSVTPAVTISSSGSTTCSGQNITFTATPTNGGNTPAYQWKNNGTAISGATNAIYSSSALTNNSVITCVLTSNASCASPSTATSNAITVNITTAVTPSVSIVSNGGSSICSGQSVTLTATPTNGGPSPAYQWYKNGTIINGATAFTYTSSSLVNNDAITCVLTSNASCLSTTTATSNAITFSITSNATASVSITANPGNSICAGQSVTFTAVPVNGGTAPTYQWYNGNSVISGATSSTYTSNTLTGGEVVTCKIVSNSQCVISANATSNAITISTSGTVTPAVTIASGSGSSICSGQSVTFTATPVNGGGSPAYQWYNGNTAISGATSSTYTSSSIANGSVITAVLTSSSACASPATATSNAITMSVASNSIASVAVASSGGTTVCAGQNITLTATPGNGGSSPAYQWMLNGNNISAATASTYSPPSIADGSVYTVQLTSNSACVTQSVVVSGPLTFSVVAGGAPVLTIASNVGLNICAGTSVTFNASITYGGSVPAYQWSKNGSNVGNGSAIYIDNALANGDVIICSVTSSLSCASPTTAGSNSLTMTVYPAPAADITQSAGVLHASAGGATYQWYLNNLSVANGNQQDYTPTSNGQYSVEVIDAHGCQALSEPFPFIYSGISEVSSLEAVSVYPNPTDNNLFVDFSGQLGDGKIVIRLLDINGRILIENDNAPVSGQKITMDVSSIQNGIYVLQISQNEASAYRKIVVGR